MLSIGPQRIFTGCEVETCIDVVEKNAPVTNISDTLCFGDSLLVGSELLKETGIFQITIPDPSGGECDSIVNIDLLVRPEIYISDSLIVRDDGSGNGAISVNIRGGSPPYEYLWNTGATLPFINNLKGDIYILVVTDALGCTQEFIFDIRRTSSVGETLQGQIILTPNPVKKGQDLGFALPEGQNNFSFGLIHTSGMQVDARDHVVIKTTNSGFILTSKLDCGVYLLYISDEKGRFTHLSRFVVVR